MNAFYKQNVKIKSTKPSKWKQKTKTEYIYNYKVWLKQIKFKSNNKTKHYINETQLESFKEQCKGIAYIYNILTFSAPLYSLFNVFL